MIRRILSAVVALAIAMLPASGAAIVSALPAAMTMAESGGMPCCPSCDTQGDFKAAACVLKCAALAAAVLPASAATLYSPHRAADGAGATEALRGTVRAPPTHPPPV
jgi:hypothetical protein